MQAQSIGPGVVVEAYLGRDKEAPTVGTGGEDVVVIIELGIAGTKLNSCIGLEVGLYEAVAHKCSKGEGEELVLLVAVH